MRTFFYCTLLLVLIFLGYAYVRNPEGCGLVAQDIKELVLSLVPAQAPPPEPAVATGPSLVQKLAAPATVAVAKENEKVAEVTPTPALIPVAPPAAIPPSTPSPAPSASSISPVADTPAPPPVAPMKRWTPPAVMPAKPYWIWTTSSGKTYQDVVVTEIKPDTVTITHSMGSGTIPIVLLPPDIQQQLNYDPEAAAAARAELDREKDHPYYRLSALAEAQAAARKLGWPLAWVEAPLELVNEANPPTNSDAELCQMALGYLRTRAVVILANGNEDLAALSPIIRDEQLFQMDDGPLPGGHHFYAPKIVFSDAGVTHAFGRVSHTQMKATRELAIEAALRAIAHDEKAQALLNGSPAK